MGAASQRRGSLWLGACCLLSLVVAFHICACQRTGGANKKPLESEGLYPRPDITTPLSHRSLCRNWHLDSSVWLPGFIGPFPSTSLDKSRVLFSCRVSWQIIAQVFAYCQDFDKPGCEKVISITFRPRGGAACKEQDEYQGNMLDQINLNGFILAVLKMRIRLVSVPVPVGLPYLMLTPRPRSATQAVLSA